MRAALIPLFVFGLAVPAAAQSHGARSATDDMPTPSIGLPLPHIGLPLPTLGLPLPQMGLPRERSERFERLERPDRFERPERPERSERFQRSERTRSAFVFVPSYGWPFLPFTAFPSSTVPAPPAKRAMGRLRLSLYSGVDPQIFVDGYYMGLFSDVAGELTLDVGPHTLELRDDGYDSLRVDVRIPLDDVITYDVDLKPAVTVPQVVASTEPPPPLPPPPPTTIYVIPGCYLGNVPPQDAGLPAGCDASRAVAFPSR